MFRKILTQTIQLQLQQTTLLLQFIQRDAPRRQILDHEPARKNDNDTIEAKLKAESSKPARDRQKLISEWLKKEK